MIDIDAIRARDAEESGTEAQNAVRYDRRALLVAYDEARRTADYWKAELNAANKVIDALRAAARKVVVASDHRTGGCTMKINDEGTSNAAHWHERAMKAEARLQKIMARCADLLDEDQFNELDAMTRTTVTVTGSEP